MASPNGELDPTLVKALLGSHLGLALKALVIEAVREAGITPGGALVPCGKKLLTVKDTAAAMSLSQREVRKMIANRELGCVRQGRRVLIEADDINGWASRHKMGASR